MKAGDAKRGLWSRLRNRAFHVYFLLRRPMTLGVRALVHDVAGGRVFLVRHTYVPGWQLPGGGVETGETLHEALAKELLEECNIQLVGEPVLLSVHQNRQASRRDHVALYHVTEFRQIAPRLPDREIAEAAFFSLDALPEATSAATLRRIEEALRGAPRSPHW